RERENPWLVLDPSEAALVIGRSKAKNLPVIPGKGPPLPSPLLQRRRGRTGAQEEIVAAEEDGAGEFLAEFVHDVGQTLLGVVLAGKDVQAKAAGETPFIDVREFEGDEAEADAAFPGFAQEEGELGVELGFQVGRFG